MTKSTERDERPHYYSQFWINVARNGGSLDNLPSAEVSAAPAATATPPVSATTEVFASPVTRKPEPPPEDLMDDLDDELPLPPMPAPKPSKNRPEKQKPALTSFADLAAIGFGAGTETDELAVGMDDDADEVYSRVAASFGRDNVEPDGDEAASLEALSEEEDEMWNDEDEEDDDGTIRRTGRTPAPKLPPRRPRRREY